jgi:threonyl-tRNA synthetase
MFIVGQREQDSGAVSVRRRVAGDIGAVDMAQAIEALRTESAGRSMEPAAPK